MKIKLYITLFSLGISLLCASIAMEDGDKKGKQQSIDENVEIARKFSATIKDMVHEETDIKVDSWSDGRTKVPVSEYIAWLSHGLLSRINQVEENLTAKLAAVESRLIKLEKRAPKEEESKKD